MKKILGIIFLSLLLQGCATDPNIGSKIIQESNSHITIGQDVYSELKGTTNSELNTHRNIASNHCSQFNKFAFQYGTRIFDEFGNGAVYFCHDKYVKNHLGHNLVWSNFSENQMTKSKDIEFTIKDKKEQCTAIGFAPATEKFADCVLRLVELDVKSQQATQIALAQSQGNQQVVTQLKKQNNSRSSDAFIDLGLKLLSPQSTASSPSTSSCTVIGSGAYKTVNCW